MTVGVRPRVVVSGYYGFGNAGDEAILATLVQELGTWADLVVLSADPATTVRDHGVAAVPRTDLRRIWQVVRGAGLFISGGGGLMQDVTGVGSVPYYGGLIRMAKLAGTPVMTLGIGLGPLRRAASRALAGWTLGACSALAVRDAGSVALMETLGLPRNRIHLTADPVLALRPAAPERTAAILEEAGIPLAGPPLVAVAVRQWPNWYERQFKSLSATLGQLASREGFRLLVLPFQHPEDMWISQEFAMCAETRPEGHRPQVTVLERPCTPSELMGIVARCQMVVGMRLHALIMAAATGVPFFGLAYDEKVRQQCARWDAPMARDLAELDDFEAFGRRLGTLWQQRDVLASALQARQAIELEAALRNFTLARDLAEAPAGVRA
ncbi:MAG: polysaccharide pyruvyl transferase CsaB [Candidatus Sericytochromatia bacterium]|nr:polysaccharide pyruvyl transferase CsaB [Candidatus Sericytochromatia bacterium]